MVRNILTYLDETASRYANKVAYRDSEGGAITFNELKKEVEMTGSYIIERFSNYTKKPVAVLTERNIRSIPAFLGVVYSGNFYVPIDATLPEDRICAMLELAEPLMIINCSDRTFNLKGNKVVDYNEIKKCAVSVVKRRNVIDIDPLYGIFTSGSTGVPKLVVKNHLSLISFIDEYVENFKFSPEDIQGNQIPFYFDASTKDLFTTLKVGCTTNIISKAYFSQPGKLAEYVENNGITSICWVPSALSMLSMFNVFSKYPLKNIKRVLFVGEPMNVKQLNIWVKALPWADFVNLYGSTENAGNCLYHIIKEEIQEDRVPIGKPFANVDVFLLDDEDKPVKQTDTESLGEICLIGNTLALGYYKNSCQCDKFCQNPLNEFYYERMYRTGDLARYDKNGNIVYVCRKDCQIKLSGYRIELCDIDIMAMKLEGVKSACSIFDESKNKIVLFYSADAELQKELIEHLKNNLPSYMVPSKYIFFEDLPLNQNGKIHRTKLKEIYNQMMKK